jgi:hypothetical protein
MVGGDAERVLQNVQGNLSRLMHMIPMVQGGGSARGDVDIGGGCT